MKKTFALLGLFFLSFNFLFCQTQTEFERLIKESKNKADTTKFVLSSRNEKHLSSLPIRTFTRDELISYLHKK